MTVKVFEEVCSMSPSNAASLNICVVTVGGGAGAQSAVVWTDALRNVLRERVDRESGIEDFLIIAAGILAGEALRCNCDSCILRAIKQNAPGYARNRVFEGSIPELCLRGQRRRQQTGRGSARRRY